jgi:hypothetical protein
LRKLQQAGVEKGGISGSRANGWGGMSSRSGGEGCLQQVDRGERGLLKAVPGRRHLYSWAHKVKAACREGRKWPGWEQEQVIQTTFQSFHTIQVWLPVLMDPVFPLTLPVCCPSVLSISSKVSRGFSLITREHYWRIPGQTFPPQPCCLLQC